MRCVMNCKVKIDIAIVAFTEGTNSTLIIRVHKEMSILKASWFKKKSKKLNSHGFEPANILAFVEERRFYTRRRWLVVYHEIEWEQGKNEWIQTRERLKRYSAWVACESILWERLWASSVVKSACAQLTICVFCFFGSVDSWFWVLRSERCQQSKVVWKGRGEASCMV